MRGDQLARGRVGGDLRKQQPTTHAQSGKRKRTLPHTPKRRTENENIDKPKQKEKRQREERKKREIESVPGFGGMGNETCPGRGAESRTRRCRGFEVYAKPSASLGEGRGSRTADLNLQTEETNHAHKEKVGVGWGPKSGVGCNDR